MEKALEKKEIMGLVQTNYPMLQNASPGQTGRTSFLGKVSPFDITPATVSHQEQSKKFVRKLSILKSSSFA